MAKEKPLSRLLFCQNPQSLISSRVLRVSLSSCPARCLQTSPPSIREKTPYFAFAFDIDGVLVRSSEPLPRAGEALRYLQSQRIPFILLTNGGGRFEAERVEQLSKALDVKLDESMFVQSHTPFTELVDGTGGAPALKDKCILVTGGDGDKCRRVAENYGFTNVVAPGDIYVAHPEIWPFSRNFVDYYESHSRPLPRPIYTPASSKSRFSLYPSSSTDLSSFLKIDAIFIFNDPRDWALDVQILMDLLLSYQGYIGTLSPKNGNPSLPNCGYLQDGQPEIYFSNPDLWWAAAWHANRFGQGAFRDALLGLWRTVTGEKNRVSLPMRMYGKPHGNTYGFSERKLEAHRKDLFGGKPDALRQVFMVGDNPESDIRGANDYQSSRGTEWTSLLVKTGVYTGGVPSCEPKAIIDNVWEAVQYGMKQAAHNQ